MTHKLLRRVVRNLLPPGPALLQVVQRRLKPRCSPAGNDAGWHPERILYRRHGNVRRNRDHYVEGTGQQQIRAATGFKETFAMGATATGGSIISNLQIDDRVDVRGADAANSHVTSQVASGSLVRRGPVRLRRRCVDLVGYGLQLCRDIDPGACVRRNEPRTGEPTPLQDDLNTGYRTHYSMRLHRCRRCDRVLSEDHVTSLRRTGRPVVAARQG